MTRLAFRPLQSLPSDVWTDPAQRMPSPFRSGWEETVPLLLREASAIERIGLYESTVVIEVDVPEGMVRQDGMLHRQARPASPRVAVSIDSVHGALRYTCDRYLGRSWGTGSRDDWRVNVRAVALGLEALRKVERYGIITRAGQQYAGWAQLGSGIPMPSTTTMTPEQAAQFLMSEAGRTGVIVSSERMACHDHDEVRRAYHAAVKAHHPDAGGAGDGGTMRRLAEARDLLIGATT